MVCFERYLNEAEGLVESGLEHREVVIEIMHSVGRNQAGWLGVIFISGFLRRRKKSTDYCDQFHRVVKKATHAYFVALQANCQRPNYSALTWPLSLHNQAHFLCKTCSISKETAETLLVLVRFYLVIEALEYEGDGKLKSLMIDS